MDKLKYKSAMNHLKTSEDFNEKTLELLTHKAQDQVRGINRIDRRKLVYVFGGLATCLALMMFVIQSVSVNNTNFQLPNSSGNVSVKYVKHFPKIHTSADLVWLSEEEVFNKYETAIFQGEVVDIKNIVIEMGTSNKNYRAIASIKVTESYRGVEEVGEVVSVLLPAPINAGIWVEDTGVVSTMRVGTLGIFMPIKYDSTSVWRENNAVLYTMDIAQYGFLDGERFAFLQTEEGIAYAEFAFESIPKQPTMEDIKAYVRRMIR